MAPNISFQDVPKLLTGNPASNSSSKPDGKPLRLRLTPISNKLASLCHALILTANAVSPSAPQPNPSVAHTSFIMQGCRAVLLLLMSSL